MRRGTRRILEQMAQSRKASMSQFIIREATAQMPSSCWGRYGKIALMEVENGVKPKMISERATGVIRIVELRDKLHMGGPRSAYALALAEMKAECDRLNAEAQTRV